jgi:hypothetical protein
MPDIASIIAGFDEARRGFREAEFKKSQAEQDREFSILSTLAQHVDPELAAIGAAGLLQLAGGSPKSSKGLKGFLGEVERSTFLPTIQAALGAGATTAAPTAGSAAQPSSAVIEPKRQAQGPGIPSVPPPELGGGMSPGALGANRVQPPTFGADTPGSTLGAPPGLDLLGDAGMMLPPMPEPPETPQQRMRRLFPTAGEIAGEQTYQQLRGRLNAVLEAIRNAQSPLEQDLVRGIAGAPRRATRMTTIPAQYRTATGQVLEGVVIFDPETGQAEVDGEPVTIVKQLPKTAPRPVGVNTNVGGTITRQFLDPTTGMPLYEVPTGMPVSEAPVYSGTATVDGNVVRLPRTGGAPEILGSAPQPAGALSPEQQQATAWLTDVTAEVKARLSTYNQTRPPGMKATALPLAQQNAVVQQLTKGRYKTIGELTAATKRQMVAPGGGASDEAGGDTARSRANRVRQRLERQSPNIVQGSGMPPPGM